MSTPKSQQEESEMTQARVYASKYWKGYEGCAAISFSRGSESERNRILGMIKERISELKIEKENAFGSQKLSKNIRINELNHILTLIENEK